jgi:hypothetical protein
MEIKDILDKVLVFLSRSQSERFYYANSNIIAEEVYKAIHGSEVLNSQEFASVKNLAPKDIRTILRLGCCD